MTSTTCTRPASHRGTMGAGYWLSTPSGPETGTRVEMPLDRSPYADQSGAAIGDGRNNLVVSTFCSIGGRGTVWLVPDMRSPTAEDVHAWTLDTPGVPGNDIKALRSARIPDHLQFVGPFLDTDGDGRMDVIVASFVD